MDIKVKHTPNFFYPYVWSVFQDIEEDNLKIAIPSFNIGVDKQELPCIELYIGIKGVI